MKHTIRQHGQLTQIDCELGSDIRDKHGKEIIEGDIVCWDGRRAQSLVYFVNGGLFIHDWTGYGNLCIRDIEIVGHVDD